MDNDIINVEEDEEEYEPEIHEGVLRQAQRLLYRVALRDDPVELQRLACRYLTDTMSPAAVRAALGEDRRGALRYDRDERRRMRRFS